MSFVCKTCGGDTKVLDSRPQGTSAIMRRRACTADPKHPRMTTLEVEAEYNDAGHLATDWQNRYSTLKEQVASLVGIIPLLQSIARGAGEGAGETAEPAIEPKGPYHPHEPTPRATALPIPRNPKPEFRFGKNSTKGR